MMHKMRCSSGAESSKRTCLRIYFFNKKKYQEDFTIMNKLQKTTAVMAAAFFAAVCNVNALAADTVVEVSSIASDIPEIVSFPADEKPFEKDNTLYVPCRVMADAMGMSTEWEQASQTATLSVNADNYSAKPIEQYAYRMSEGVDNSGMDLEPEDISVQLRAGSEYALVKFDYADTNGETVSYGKTVELDGIVRMLDGGTVMFPLRSVIEAFGLELEWEQVSRTAAVVIPQITIIPDNLGIIADDMVQDTTSSAVASAAESETEAESDMTYLGTFRISHYAPGAESNGTWGNATAWGGDITPGRTIAVDKNVIEPLSWVYIDGYGYRCAEDCGGAIKGNMIDVAVSTYSEAMSLGVVYKDVYLCK